MLLPLATLRAATFGQSAEKASLLAIEEINAAGGLLGRKLELVTEDDPCKQGEAATSARKLISRHKVVAVVGEMVSSRSLEIAPDRAIRADPDDQLLDQSEGHRHRQLYLPRLLHRFPPGEGHGPAAISTVQDGQFRFLQSVGP